ncbi:Octanoyltransferase LipM [Clarias magur]|uniref:Octanoyltransferase LipM n=1 Tax=Clarias magur TaxID=1594786 RepID=A0A8J4XG98_CLAMG|nr:Octanoyltransferase LipM [Clarias magur]
MSQSSHTTHVLSCPHSLCQVMRLSIKYFQNFTDRTSFNVLRCLSINTLRVAFSWNLGVWN